MIDIDSLQLGILELTFVGLKYEMGVAKAMEWCDFLHMLLSCKHSTQFRLFSNGSFSVTRSIYLITWFKQAIEAICIEYLFIYP